MRHEDLIDFLIGNWKISRKITQANGEQIEAEGNASFTKMSDGLKYTDNIKLASNIDSFQEYFYKLEDRKLRVNFVDGSLFYELGSDGYTSHRCKEDIYNVEYIFYPDSFSLTYFVSGPEKDYNMTTKYKRLV